MELSALVRDLDLHQRRRPLLAVLVAVGKKFAEDGAERLGVQIAYWGFFSVFALLLVFASILGFALKSDPSLQRELLNSTLERMPVLGPQIRGDIGTLTGNGLALAIGLASALWTGLGVTLAIGNGLDRVWAVPRTRQAGFLGARLRGLVVLATFGTVNVLATVGVGFVTGGAAGGPVVEALSLIASGAIDLVLFSASFLVLTSAPVTLRQILPGALLASGCWFVLQLLGGLFVTDVLAGSSQTYGGFAAVVGLLTWLLIGSQLLLVAAELNVVLARGLWPRSLSGPLLDADRRVLADYARAAQLDPREQIEVSFAPSRQSQPARRGRRSRREQ